MNLCSRSVSLTDAAGRSHEALLLVPTQKREHAVDCSRVAQNDLSLSRAAAYTTTTCEEKKNRVGREAKNAINNFRGNKRNV